LDTLLLLGEQKRPILQHDEGDVDGWNDQVGANPLNGGWDICEMFLNCISDELMPILLEELE
jgi:hypothetical protein